MPDATPLKSADAAPLHRLGELSGLLQELLDGFPAPAALISEDDGSVVVANARFRDLPSDEAEPDAALRLSGAVETTLHLVSESGAPLRLLVLDRRRSATDTVSVGLTGRERDVASLIAAGLRNREIAARLGLSPFTVKRHAERLLRKLGLSNRAAVAAVFTTLRDAGARPIAPETSPAGDDGAAELRWSDEMPSDAR